MASQPPANLPLFYNDLIPLSSVDHADFKSRNTDRAPFFAKAHAVPVTVDEFAMAQRFYPIVFSSGPNPVPLGLFGLNEGVNVFLEDDGRLRNPIYIPAYVRRYPYMLAKLRPDTEELSLCFDPTTDTLGAGGDGIALFENAGTPEVKPSETLNGVLKFCEDFEIAGQRTAQFITDVTELELLMEGEVSIQPTPDAQPYVYRGFQMVDDKKLQDLRGDQLRKLNQNGSLGLIYAHLYSLSQISDIFNRMMQLGKVPMQAPQVSINPVV